MLKGRFGGTTTRPYIEGRVILPRLGVRGDVSFLLDTGADLSVLMPLDGRRLGIDYRRLQGRVESVGIGGTSHDYREPGLLIFAESAKTLRAYELDLVVAASSSEILDLPSLLGRDVLNRWRITMDYRAGELACEVLSADYTVKVPRKT